MGGALALIERIYDCRLRTIASIAGILSVIFHLAAFHFSVFNYNHSIDFLETQVKTYGTRDIVRLAQGKMT